MGKKSQQPSLECAIRSTVDIVVHCRCCHTAKRRIQQMNTRRASFVHSPLWKWGARKPKSKCWLGMEWEKSFFPVHRFSYQQQNGIPLEHWSLHNRRRRRPSAEYVFQRCSSVCMCISFAFKSRVLYIFYTLHIHRDPLCVCVYVGASIRLVVCRARVHFGGKYEKPIKTFILLVK